METAFGLSIPRSLEDVCNARDMALVIYDMQIGIVRQVNDGAGIVAKCAVALDAARSAGVRVFYTRHMSLPRELMGMSQYRMAMAWQRVKTPEEVKPWFLRDSPAFPIVPELTPRASEAVFDKLAMSAFEGTPLGFALRDCGIKAVAFAGVATEIGIEPSCRHGADLGFIPILIEDACGFGHADAAARSVEALKFTGDTIVTDLATFQRTVAGR
jgi:nicotinamidase-related amidase